MPDLTSRLALKKPRGGSSGSAPAEQVDIDVINGNMDSLDAAVGAFQTASTALPALPYNGQVVRETDTGDLIVYNSGSSAWVAVAGNNPRPVMTNSQSLANIGNTGTVVFASQPAAVTWPREQRCLITLTFGLSAASNAAGFIYLQLNGTNLLATPIRFSGLTSAARYPITIVGFGRMVAGSNSFALKASTDAGGAGVNYNDIVWNVVTA